MIVFMFFKVRPTAQHREHCRAAQSVSRLLRTSGAPPSRSWALRTLPGGPKRLPALHKSRAPATENPSRWSRFDRSHLQEEECRVRKLHVLKQNIFNT